jgi:acyl carrier protein
MTVSEPDPIANLLQTELARATGEPIAVFRDDALLSDLGVDSLSLVEALLNTREQILADLRIPIDDAGDPPTLPWIETVGELIAYVRSAIPGDYQRNPSL